MVLPDWILQPFKINNKTFRLTKTEGLNLSSTVDTLICIEEGKRYKMSRSLLIERLKANKLI